MSTQRRRRNQYAALTVAPLLAASFAVPVDAAQVEMTPIEAQPTSVGTGEADPLLGDVSFPGAGAEGPLVIEIDDPARHDPSHHDPALVTPAAETEVDAARSEVADGTTWSFRSVPTAAAATGGLSVHYITSDQAALPPADVQLVVDEAIRRWNAVLSTDAAIVVDFAWYPLGNNLLGAGGPTTIHQAGLPAQGGAYYPAALASHIAGYDVNGSSQAEIEIFLDSTRYVSGGWFTNLASGSPTFGSRDLLSTVIHEIAHGLGFLGSATSDGAGNGVWGDSLLVYDLLAEHNGSDLLSLSGGESHLTTGPVQIDLGGGRLYKLYAPGTFIAGSSFSHFDETSYPASTAGALMTPVLSSGEVQRVIDGATLAVLVRLGWTVSATVATPSFTSVTGGSAGKVAVTWQAPFGGPGQLPPTSFTVDVYEGSTRVTSGSFGALDGGVNITGLTSFADQRIVLTAAHPAGGTSSVTAYTDGRPAFLAVTGSGTARTISWPAPNGAGTEGASYHLERRLVGSQQWSRLAATANRSFDDTGVADGVYQYRVRAVSAAGSSPWRLSTVEGIAASADRPMPLDGQVARLYAASLGRNADSSGLAFWINARVAGQGLESIAGQFASSNEFTTTYGTLGDAAFVDLVYANVLGRSPDASGRAFWLDQLAKGRSRGSLIVGFSESPEYVARTGTGALQSTQEGRVYRLYLAYFLREPDTGGFEYWVGRIAAGTDLRVASQAFAQSSEFVDTYGSLTDERFVDLVYRNVLGREADPAGRAHWIGRLSAGTTRGEMMIGFSESPEFVLQTGTTP